MPVGSTLTQARQSAREGGGGTPLTSLIGAVVSAANRRREEDKARQAEEDALTRELQKMNEQETQKRRTELEKIRETSRLETERGQTLLRTLGIGGRQKEAEGITGLEEIPAGVSLKAGDITITGQKTPEQIGTEKATAEAFTRAEGIKRAAKRLGSIVRQYNRALPSEQIGETTISQRISGFFAVKGAQTGFKPNPDLLALIDTGKLQLRGILRDMGEGARMSDQDINQNIAVIMQAGLSNEERKAKIKSFMQVAVDAMDTPILNNLQKDRNFMDMLGDFGVIISKTTNGAITEGEDIEYQQFLKAIQRR